MGLTESRLCGMGQQCTQYPELGHAAKLSRYNEESICEACRRTGYRAAVAGAEHVLPIGEAKSSKGLCRRGQPWAIPWGYAMVCEHCWEKISEGKTHRWCEPWDEDPASPEERYAGLLSAARVLFEVGAAR